MIARAQAEAIATAITQVRDPSHPRWDRPGILAAITETSRMGTPADILVALAQLARRADIRTPMYVLQPGPHWAGTAVAERKAPTMCGRHPEHTAARCPACDAEATGDPRAGAALVRDAYRNAPRLQNPAAKAAQEAKRRAAYQAKIRAARDELTQTRHLE